MTPMILTALLLVAPYQGVHPCDDVLPVNPTLKAPVVAGFCHDDTTISVRIYIDNAVVWQGVPTRVTGVNAEGLYYFETPNLTVAKGTHLATIQPFNADGSAPLSEGYTFTISGPPGQAKKPRIRGGGE